MSISPHAHRPAMSMVIEPKGRRHCRGQPPPKGVLRPFSYGGKEQQDKKGVGRRKGQEGQPNHHQQKCVAEAVGQGGDYPPPERFAVFIINH